MSKETIQEQSITDEKIIYDSQIKRQKMRIDAAIKRNAVLSALLMSSLIFALCIFCIFASNDDKYSENENRYLAQKPKLSLVSVIDERFMKDTDSYLSDHFFARDSFVKTKTYFDIFLGKVEINDIYIGKNHYLFEKPSEYNEDRIGETLNKIISFSDDHMDIKSYIALVPNSSEILSNLMPTNAPNQDQKWQIRYVYSRLSNINCIDVYSQLMNAPDKQKFYYKTDHHWTTLGAQTAFFEIAKSMNLDTTQKTFNLYAVSNQFQGTLASSSGLFSAKDDVYIPVYEPDEDYIVNYVDENKKTTTIYDYSKLNRKNNYDVFFGGNYSQINIETNNQSDRTLLIIKDSYANCLIPMMIPYYKKIVIIDPRYYFGDINRTVRKEEVTEILWLYNTNTFLNDTSIKDTF